MKSIESNWNLVLDTYCMVLDPILNPSQREGLLRQVFGIMPSADQLGARSEGMPIAEFVPNIYRDWILVLEFWIFLIPSWFL